MTKTNTADDNAVDEVIARNDFYRDGYEAHRKLAIILVIALFVSVSFNIVLFKIQPDVRVIALDESGRAVKVISLKEPMLTPAKLQTWVVEKSVELYTYDFRNWRKHFQKMGGEFTSHGWTEFSNAMKESRTIELIEDDDVIVSAVPLGAAVIVKEGDLNGVYAWKVEFPLLVTYEGASDVRTQELLVTAVIVRDNLVEHPVGIAIEQIISRDK